MLTEWELWAVAAKVIEQHGDTARAHAEERQRALEAAGDTGGVNAWSAVLARIEQLQALPAGPLN